jgi:hypothetical protein
LLLISDFFGILQRTVVISDYASIAHTAILPFICLLFVYTAVSKGHITIKGFSVLMLIFFIVLVFVYFNFFYINLVISSLTDSGYASVGSVYYLLIASSGCLLLRNKKQKYFLIIIVFIIIFSSMKRGGILAISLGVLFYAITSFFIFKKHTLGKIITIVFGLSLLLIALIVFIVYLNDLFGGQVYNRLTNIGQDRGSGRLDIYRDVLNNYKEFSIFEELLGRGVNNVSKSIGLSAHNDFLEVLFNHGLFGLACLIIIVFKLIIWNIKLIMQKYQYANVLTYTMWPFIVFLVISHVVIYPLFLLFVIIWGVLLADYYKEDKIIIRAGA